MIILSWWGIIDDTPSTSVDGVTEFWRATKPFLLLKTKSKKTITFAEDDRIITTDTKNVVI